MEDNIHGTAEILTACCEAFVERARGWYCFNIHPLNIKSHLYGKIIWSNAGISPDGIKE